VGRQLVANLSVYEELDRNGQSDPVLEVFRKQAESSVVMSSRPEMQAVWSPVDNALRTVVYGKADAAAALKEAQQKVDRDIAGMGK
jgi:maltose-binding protein MalE